MKWGRYYFAYQNAPIPIRTVSVFIGGMCFTFSAYILLCDSDHIQSRAASTFSRSKSSVTFRATWVATKLWHKLYEKILQLRFNIPFNGQISQFSRSSLLSSLGGGRGEKRGRLSLWPNSPDQDTLDCLYPLHFRNISSHNIVHSWPAILLCE